jgi:hypothetical protein
VELKQPLEHANHILSTFTQVRLHVDPYGTLWVVGPPMYQSKCPQLVGHVLCRENDLPRRAFRARVKNDWPAFDYGQLEMGGTQAQAVANLINWVRGKGTGKMAFWRYAAQDNVRGINCYTLELLERYGYGKDETR